MNANRFFSTVNLLSAGLTTKKKTIIWLLLLLAGSNLTAQAATIVHDISTGVLIITGNSADDYIITGTTKTNYVVVEAGYQGTITLRNVNISLSGYYSPITIKGENYRSNLTPITNVDIILEGENFLTAGMGECHTIYCWTALCGQYKYSYWLDQQNNNWYRKECYLYDGADDWECHDYEYGVDGVVYEDSRQDDWNGYVRFKQWFEGGCMKFCYLYEWSVDWECYEDCESSGTSCWSECGDVCGGDDCWESMQCDEVYGIAAFQVDQGAQINISAIDPSDNNSGTLNAIVTTEMGGAGIGALNRSYNGEEAIGTAPVSGGCEETVTAGGNIVISSGTVIAQGGHGAGIGGGYGSYYDGMIVIYGGIVEASSIRHSAGIGSGCPLSRGVESCYTPNSAIIVLPPAQITATGAHESYEQRPDLALAGANIIIYIGDPEKPLITVRTEDFEPFANIYVDLSENPDVAKVIDAIVPTDRLDINKIKFGQAGSDGIYQFHGILEDNTTFFTDAVSSSTPAALGRPYRPKTVRLPDGAGVNRTVILELLNINMSIEAAPSVPLCENYTASDALISASRVKITFSDNLPMSNVVFDVAGGTASDFLSGDDMLFYSSDGITEIPAPTTLKKGDVIYAVFPLKTGKTADIYADVFRFRGTWDGLNVDYIRQVITQNVESLHVTAIASPVEGGTVSVYGFYPCGVNVTVSATPNFGYNFVNWTVGTVTVSTNEIYTFTTTEDVTIVANFELKTYPVTVSANPEEGGAVSSAGIYTHGNDVTVSATPNDRYMFVNWTEDGVNVSTDAAYTFTITDSHAFIANFIPVYTVNVDVNNPDYGYATGAGDYPRNDIAKVEAFVHGCYRFANWTVNGIVFSTNNPYEFSVTEDVNITANFYALDFDTYAPVLWDNTFMLNLKKLEEDGYEVTGCKWFKNGIEEIDTRTIDEYSYSAGYNETDLLQQIPASYMFQLNTKNFGILCSGIKTIDYKTSVSESKVFDILAYPNPLPSGSRLTIEGVTKGSVVFVYNQAGACVYSAVATDNVLTLTLPVTSGVYLICNGDKTIKVVVTN